MQFSRTALLIGEANVEKLKKARVAVFGLGGVGSYVVEALARSAAEPSQHQSRQMTAAL